MIILKIKSDDNSYNKTFKENKFPLKIGREVDNDIVIPIKSVSSYHLVIEKVTEEQYQITNLSNTNPMVFEGEELSTLQLIDGSNIIKIGRVEIEFILELGKKHVNNTNLEKTEVILFKKFIKTSKKNSTHEREHVYNFEDEFKQLCIIIILYLLAIIIKFILDAHSESVFIDIGIYILTTFIIIPLFALMFSFISKLFTKSFQFLYLIKMTYLFTSISIIIQILVNITSFNLFLKEQSIVLSIIIDLLKATSPFMVAFVLLFFILRTTFWTTIKYPTSKKPLVISLGFAFFVASVHLETMQTNESITLAYPIIEIPSKGRFLDEDLKNFDELLNKTRTTNTTTTTTTTTSSSSSSNTNTLSKIFSTLQEVFDSKGQEQAEKMAQDFYKKQIKILGPLDLSQFRKKFDKMRCDYFKKEKK